MKNSKIARIVAATAIAGSMSLMAAPAAMASNHTQVRPQVTAERSEYAKGYRAGYKDGLALAKSTCKPPQKTMAFHHKKSEYDQGYEKGFDAGFKSGVDLYCQKGDPNDPNNW